MVAHTAEFLEDSRRFLFDEDQLSGVYQRAGLIRTHLGLDVGCGSGYFTRIAAGHNPESTWFGVGVDESVLKAARQLGSAGIRTIYLRANAERLPFADSTFDSTCCHFLLTRINRVAATAVIGEMMRVTKPDGQLL